jgi:LDH2 family malate/lactate/ureidoglycolate dehydrogenase
MQRLPTLVARIANGVLDPSASPSIASRRAAAAFTVDGRHGFGPPAAQLAIRELRDAARRFGLGVAAIRDAGHLGMLAPYVEQLASKGLIGIAFSTSEALVHPAGGRLALLGTNPIAIAIAVKGEPFVLDMSTAAISAGEVIVHAERGTRLPEGRAIDAEGHPTLDPSAAMGGALSPFGGPKGYALGLGVELLVAALAGSELGTRVHGTLDVDKRSTKGDALIAIDPAALNAAGVEDRASEYLHELRSSPPAPGSAGILIPGDRMRAERARRMEAGILYPAGTWRRLLALGREEVRTDA